MVSKMRHCKCKSSHTTHQSTNLIQLAFNLVAFFIWNAILLIKLLNDRQLMCTLHILYFYISSNFRISFLSGMATGTAKSAILVQVFVRSTGLNGRTCIANRAGCHSWFLFYYCATMPTQLSAPLSDIPPSRGGKWELIHITSMPFCFGFLFKK